MPAHMAGAVLPAVPCATNVSQRKAPGAISAIAFMVKPVKPKVGFISAAVFSAIESLLVIVGGLDGGRGAGRIGVRLLPILPTSGHEGKRKFLIAEIRVLNAAGDMRLSAEGGFTAEAQRRREKDNSESTEGAE